MPFRWLFRARSQAPRPALPGIDVNTLRYAQGSNALSELLSEEMAQWYRNLGHVGVGASLFVGLDATQRQIMTAINMATYNLPTQERRAFLIWLIQTERIVAYAFGYPVAKNDETGALTHELVIQATCSQGNRQIYMPLVECDGKAMYQAYHRYTTDDWQPYANLRADAQQISNADAQTFEAIWRDMLPKAKVVCRR